MQPLMCNCCIKHTWPLAYFFTWCCCNISKIHLYGFINFHVLVRCILSFSRFSLNFCMTNRRSTRHIMTSKSSTVGGRQKKNDVKQLRYYNPVHIKAALSCMENCGNLSQNEKGKVGHVYTGQSRLHGTKLVSSCPTAKDLCLNLDWCLSYFGVCMFSLCIYDFSSVTWITTTVQNQACWVFFILGHNHIALSMTNTTY